MKVIDDKPLMIFRHENEKYGPFYSIGQSERDINGEYTNGYIPCRFKKGVELNNKTRIKIKDAWLKFYNKDKTTVTYVFINDFDIVEEKEEDKKESTITGWDSAKNIEIDPDELPFY